VLFGRNSYDLINNYWLDRYKLSEATPAEIEYSNWYNSAQKIVISTTIKENAAADVMVIDENIKAEILKIKHSAGKIF